MMAPALGQTDALARLRQSALSRAGLALVTGEPGIGKTMVRLALVRDLRVEPSLLLAELINPAAWRTDITFLRAVASAFGIAASGRTTLELTTELQKSLGALIEEDIWPLLIVDDAQRLTSSQVDLVRSLLGPDERSPRLSVLLFGEPEIEERINRRQALARQLAMRHTLNPLNANDAAGLVRFRLQVAGVDDEAEIFAPEALAQLVERSGGNPRALVMLAAASIDLAASTRQASIDRDTAQAATRRNTTDGSADTPVTGHGKR
jgi:type II secretory pathway predicted ATPase ExeA